MDYNTQRSQLRIPEYGRIIQQMVDHCCTLPDKEERTKAAYTIIRVMENTNATIKEEVDYQRKLWDQLAVMSNFKLDINWPCEVLTKDLLLKKPESLPYSNGTIRFKHYGKITEYMLKKLERETDPEKKKLLFIDMANYMKRSYVQWKKELIPDDVVYREIVYLSDGKIEIPADVRLGDYKDALVQEVTIASKSKKKKVVPIIGNPQKKKKNGGIGKK